MPTRDGARELPVYKWAPPRVSEDQGYGSVTHAGTVTAAIRSRSQVENASSVCANGDTRAEARNAALPRKWDLKGTPP